jgi:hypothetical protein
MADKTKLKHLSTEPGFLARWLSKPFRLRVNLTVEECTHVINNFSLNLRRGNWTYASQTDDAGNFKIEIQNVKQISIVFGSIQKGDLSQTIIGGRRFTRFNDNILILIAITQVVAYVFLYFSSQPPKPVGLICLPFYVILSLHFLLNPNRLNSDLLLSVFIQQLQSAELQRQQPDNRV